MTLELIETIAIYVTGAMTAAVSVLAYALTSYFISGREYNRRMTEFFEGVMEAKEKEEQDHDG